MVGSILNIGGLPHLLAARRTTAIARDFLEKKESKLLYDYLCILYWLIFYVFRLQLFFFFKNKLFPKIIDGQPQSEVQAGGDSFLLLIG